MIYTSYFAKVGGYDRNKYLLVSIALINPKWLTDFIREPLLNPSDTALYDVKTGRIDKEEYTKLYLAKLNNIGSEAIINWLNDLQNNNPAKDIILCCYERSDNFCHRHILRKFLQDNNFNIEEL